MRRFSSTSIVALAFFGCGRIWFEQVGDDASCPCDGGREPGVDAAARDAGAAQDAGSGDDAGPATCADLAGRACDADETCAFGEIETSDVAACCANSGCIPLGSRLVAEAERGPVVLDADASEWAGLTRYAIEKVSIGAPPLTTDVSGIFSVRWDESALYILVAVIDDTIRPVEGTLPWEDDGIEIYVDLDPRSLDDTWNERETWCYLLIDASVVMGKTVSDAFEVSNAGGRTGAGYFFEVMVTWPDDPPAPGTLIGFDVAVNDHDGTAGTGRQNQLFWNDGTGQLYNDASLIGLLRLN